MSLTGSRLYNRVCTKLHRHTNLDVLKNIDNNYQHFSFPEDESMRKSSSRNWSVSAL